MSLRKRSRLYYRLCVVSSLLLILGTAIVLSSSTGQAIEKTGNPFYYFQRHLIWLCIGGLAMWLVNRIGLHRIEKNRRFSMWIFLISLFLLPLPQFLGTLRWIVFGPFSFQPAELVKLTFVIFLADHLRRTKDYRRKIKPLFWPIFHFLFITVLLQFQKDLGTFVLIFLSLGLLLYLAGQPRRHLASLAFSGVVIFVLLIWLFPYRRDRFIHTFVNPNDTMGKGYQPFQSKVTLGTGGWLGRGIGAGLAKLFYLPEAHKDYVYAIVGEEMGLLGTSTVLFFFAVLTISGLELSLRARDDFQRFMAAGIGGLFGFQFLLHAGVVLCIIPAKGTTLPFFSVGGSSLLTNLMSLGILLAIGRDACFPSSLEDLQGTSLLQFDLQSRRFPPMRPRVPFLPR
ncbi:MAG: putative lipid II flippase FtsW [Candidatus Omnitrophica bacterium]|nr:putative lipid II flippase FtsW [Candidatus Omnitrophota bacterium]